jgi:hypothetical protein
MRKLIAIVALLLVQSASVDAADLTTLSNSKWCWKETANSLVLISGKRIIKFKPGYDCTDRDPNSYDEGTYCYVSINGKVKVWSGEGLVGWLGKDGSEIEIEWCGDPS